MQTRAMMMPPAETHARMPHAHRAAQDGDGGWVEG